MPAPCRSHPHHSPTESLVCVLHALLVSRTGLCQHRTQTLSTSLHQLKTETSEFLAVKPGLPTEAGGQGKCGPHRTLLSLPGLAAGGRTRNYSGSSAQAGEKPWPLWGTVLIQLLAPKVLSLSSNTQYSSHIRMQPVQWSMMKRSLHTEAPLPVNFSPNLSNQSDLQTVPQKTLGKC